MSNLQNLGTTDEPLGALPNAEFVEVSNGSASPGPAAAPDLSIGAWWREIPKAQKVIFFTIIGCFGLFLLGSLHIEDTPPSALTPAQIAAATDMAVVAGGETASGQPVYLDDQPTSAPEDCGGKFIWAFNTDGTAGTVSLRDEAGTSVTSGIYHLANQTLHLTKLAEKPGNDDPALPGRRVKNVTYHVDRTSDGRVIIGKKNYRQCTLRTEPTAAAPAPSNTTRQPTPEPTPQPVVAAAPPPSLTPDAACEQLSGQLVELVESTSDGTLKVLEASARKGSSSVRDDGTLSCVGSVITNRGTLVGLFGTTYTPKGKLLVTWNVDEILTKLANNHF